MTKKAILFDYGDTLISIRLDWLRVIRANIENLSNTLKPLLPAINTERLARDFMFLRSVGKQRAASEWIETSADESLAKALSLQGLPTVAPWIIHKGVDAFFTPEEHYYSVLSGVPEMLSKLKAAGLMLALVSNATCGRLIRRTLSRANLLSYFDQVVVSADLGICKPNPALFKHAISSLPVEPENTLMVGDRMETDIAGASSAGIRSVLVDFFGDQPSIPLDGPQPDAIVRHPQELSELVLAWM